MSWTQSSSVTPLLSRVAVLHARAQRLQLLQRIETFRAMAAAAGAPVDDLDRIKAEVQACPLPAAEKASSR